MKIVEFSIHPYDIPLTTGYRRQGAFVHIVDDRGNGAWGEIAPLPKWSQETLAEALRQLEQKKPQVLELIWTENNCFEELSKLSLLPSVLFGVESAILSLLKPLSEYSLPISALLMGMPQEILGQARLRKKEGYSSAKLKVSNLSFDEAEDIILQLKDVFCLRVDVNRAWSTNDSLHFFSQFPLDAFDYVEEPFRDPRDLARFSHPLAVDESFPNDLSLEQLEALPTLKALIYKPTIQGGMLSCIPLYEWSKSKGIDLVLSSCFESDIGLAHIVSIAHRLSLSTHVGIGTYNYLDEHVSACPLTIANGMVHISGSISLFSSKEGKRFSQKNGIVL